MSYRRTSYGKVRLHAAVLALFLAVTVAMACAQASGKSGTARPAAPDYSGMYSFLREGEFVQVTVETGRVTGFISRYGDSEGDRGEFLDHFFTEGKLDGTHLTFKTKTVHGVSYEFRGTVDRGASQNPGEEAYYVLRGTLVVNTIDDAKKTSSHSQEVALKSFPQDVNPTPAEKK